MPAPKPLEDLVIKDWQKGIAESPHVGFAHMRNIDVISTPGIVKITGQTVKESATTITGLVKSIVRDPVTANLYALDNGNKVYKSTDQGDTWTNITGTRTVTGGDGDGIVVWKNHLLAMRDTKIDVMVISTEVWTNDWQTITTGSKFHPALWAQNDKAYIGAGRYVTSVAEVSGQTFAPGSAATYTFTAQALDLPAQYKIKCLSELGKWLMIGTWVGTSLKEQPIADIFPWDLSEEPASFNLPLRLTENGISQLLTINSLLYVMAGVQGRIYVSDGSSIRLLKALRHLAIASGDSLDPYPGAFAYQDGKLLFSFVQNDGVPNPLGIYSLDLNTGSLILQNTVSSGATGELGNTVSIGAIFPTFRDRYLIGWQDATAQGIDSVAFNGYRYTSYAAYIETRLSHVGTALNRRAFTQLEFYLAKDLASGQGLKFSYRTNLTDAFSTAVTADFATYGAVNHQNISFGVPEADFLQLKIELTTGASSTTTPELRELRLR